MTSLSLEIAVLPLRQERGGSSRGRPRFRDSPLNSCGTRMTVHDWSFMSGRANRRINYFDKGELEVAAEINYKAIGLRWKAGPALKLKYVDDWLILAKINM